MKFAIHEKIGQKGKDGIVYLIKDHKGKSYAMKKFRSNKSLTSLKKEIALQKIAAKDGLSPNIIEVNLDERWIVMDLLSNSFFEKFKESRGKISIKNQEEIVEIINKLDRCGVFHGDPNILNFMEKDGRLYIVDFGFAEMIDEKLIKKYGEQPNKTFMIIGLLVKLREICPDVRYTFLLKSISKKDREGFGFN